MFAGARVAAVSIGGVRLAEGWRLPALIGSLVLVRLGVYAAVIGAWGRLPYRLCTFDCVWYTRLAQEGYDLHSKPAVWGQGNWSFMPVFPGLMRLAVDVTGMPYHVAATVVANLCFGLFVFAAVKYLAVVRPGAEPLALVAFMFVYPYGFYDSLGYTESLFGALMMAALYCLAREKLFAASLAVGVMTATRPTGLLMVPVLGVRYLWPVLQAWRRGETGQARAMLMEALLPLAIAPLGLFLFMAYLYVHLGDALAFAHGEWAFGRRPMFALAELYHSLTRFDFGNILSKTTQSRSYDGLCAVAGLAMGARLLMMGRREAAWFMLAGTWMALSSGVFSMPRYVLANPIFEVYLFDLIWAGGLRRWFLPLALGGAALQLYFISLWPHSYSAFY